MTLRKTINVVNKESSPATFDVAYEPVVDMAGVTFSLNKSSVTVPGNSSRLVRASVTLTRNALRKDADPTIDKEQEVAPGFSLPREFIGEASGRVVFTPTAGADVGLRVPVYIAPRPTANIIAPEVIFTDGPDGDAFLQLSGRGLSQGSGDRGFNSIYSVMELAATSPQLERCGTTATTNCTLNRTGDGGDLHYVGVASTAPQAIADGHPEDSMIGFGIATWLKWRNLGVNTVPFVDIDVDGDDVPDYETFALRSAGTDILEAWTVALTAGFPVVDIEPVNTAYGDFDTNTFDNKVVVLPVFLAALGIDPTDTSARISYTVGVDGFYEAPDDGLVDFIPDVLTFDPLQPGLWAEGSGASLLYLAEPGTGVAIHRNAASLELDGGRHLLVLNHHNGPDGRATVTRGDDSPHPDPSLLARTMSPGQHGRGSFMTSGWRRGRDSNPRSRLPHSTV